MALAVHGLSNGQKKTPAPSPETLEDFKALVAGEADPDEIVIVEDDDENKQGTDGQEDDVEIVDDTPPEDRGREQAPLDSSYDDLDKGIEEELRQIQGAQGLKRRIPEIVRQRNEERRAKEAEVRARAEATEFARQVLERNKQLEKMLEDAGKYNIAALQQMAKTNIEAARKSLRDANESGDFDAITKAQEELNRAVLGEQNAANARMPTPPSMPQPPQLTQVDPKVQAWTQKNTWFLKHKTLTTAALEFHEEALKKGLTSQEDSYYSFIDEKMKPLLSAYGLAPDPSPGTNDPARKKTADAVTPVSRSSGAAPKREQNSSPKTFVLSRTQAALAVELMPDIAPAEARKRYALQLAKQKKS